MGNLSRNLHSSARKYGMRKLATVGLLLLLWGVATTGFVALSSTPPHVQAAAPLPTVSKEHPVDFDRKLHNLCIYPTFKISAKNSTRVGSGVIVRSDKVGDAYYNVAITCYHCVDNSLGEYLVNLAVYERKTKFKSWETHPLVVYHYDAKRDIAIVLFKTSKPVSVAKMRFGLELNMGNKLLHVGCGQGDQPRFDEGKVTGLNSKVNPHLTELYRTNVHVIPGDSGGPFFYRHQVIGIAQAIKVTSFRGLPQILPNISMVIPIDVFKTWDAEENKRLAFLYTKEAKLPVLPYMALDYTVEWPKIEDGE